MRHCHLYPLYSWQDMLLTFAEMELDSTAMFTPGTNIMLIHSTGEPVLAQVVGYSEHSDAYRRISYEREAPTVLPLYSFVLQCNFCACMVVVWFPRGGMGDHHLATVPQGWRGTVFSGVGQDKGGVG